MNKAEQLIACLEVEIAKRDARIVELKDQAFKRDGRARERDTEILGLRAELAAIKAQGVVIPELELQAAADEAFGAWEKAGERIPHAMAYMAARDGFREGAAWQARLNAAPVQHPDDDAVDRFAIAMKAKLAASREKGRHGWQNATAPHLSSLLHEHMYKADPLDVGNLAMMLHQNGQAIELPHDARRVAAPVQQVSVPDLKPLRYHASKITSRVNAAAEEYEAGRSALGFMEDIAESALILHNGLESMLAAPAAPAADAELVEALETIAHWHLPETGQFWPSGGPVSYEAQHGSNGARDYMRGVAQAALTAHRAKGVV